MAMYSQDCSQVVKRTSLAEMSPYDLVSRGSPGTGDPCHPDPSRLIPWIGLCPNGSQALVFPTGARGKWPCTARAAHRWSKGSKQVK